MLKRAESLPVWEAGLAASKRPDQSPTESAAVKPGSSLPRVYLLSQSTFLIFSRRHRPALCCFLSLLFLFLSGVCVCLLPAGASLLRKSSCCPACCLPFSLAASDDGLLCLRVAAHASCSYRLLLWRSTHFAMAFTICFCGKGVGK